MPVRLCGEPVRRSGKPGRPRRWCSDRCRAVASHDRARARMILARAERYDELAAETAAGRMSMYGSVASLERLAGELYVVADEIFERVGR
jgi:endogenous inhibitor of DNA gyrase (YacG/DUF329 family)